MAKLPERIMVKQYLEPISFTGPVSSVQEMLISLVEEYPEFTLHIEDDYSGYDGGQEYNLYGERLETDEEYEFRMDLHRADLKKTKLASQKKLEKERAEYERLRKKFEKA
jgi:hypothetical protein